MGWKLFLAAVVIGFVGTAKADSQVVDAIKHVSKIKFVRSIPLANRAFPMAHPQGLKVVGKNIYISTVEESKSSHGYLLKFKLDSVTEPLHATPLKRLSLDPGPSGKMIHAGGIDLD